MHQHSRGLHRRVPTPGQARLFLVLVLAAVLLAGCAGVTVRHAPLAERFDALDRSALNSNQPSELTLAYLKQRDLTEQWTTDPEGLVLALDAKYRKEPGRGSLFALMELSHLLAKKHAFEPDRAAEYDLSCAVYASLFLFDPNLLPARGFLMPNTRLASEFYNRSLSRYLLHARATGLKFHPGMRLSLAAGTLEIRERQSGLPFQPEAYSAFHLAFEYAVSGLDVTHALPGLGVPLILERNNENAGVDLPENRYLPRVRQVFAATLFLRLDFEAGFEKNGQRIYQSRVELHDPMRVDSIQVGDATVPLETDTTTPLAWMAAHAPAPQGIRGLMDPAALEGSQGLYMLQPFQKDKIPVVFVHGLISSPMTWLPMINGLMGDPVLRQRYQFWYFSYPTGNPVFYSAKLLRESLENAQRSLDPDGKNPNFNNMLIVGHSMGGLLAKAMVQDSGNALWHTLTETPPSNLPISPEAARLLDSVFFFKPLPFVTEAVFVSAPHRGSEMALGTIGKIGRALVTLPVTLAKTSAAVLGSLATLGHRLPISTLPTGIDGLSPKNPLLLTSAALPVAVPFHSIIGNEDKAGAAGGTDGVVPYWSSHLDCAQSELIVKSGHNAHEHPLAIREIRRIMLEHMEKLPAKVPCEAAAP